MEKDEKIKLARIDERVLNIAKSFEDHEDNDSERFDKTFNFVKEGFDKIDNRFDKVDARLGKLWDIKNKHDGAFGVGKMIAGGIGGVFVALVDFIIYNGGHIK